jgi:hypothetical protein
MRILLVLTLVLPACGAVGRAPGAPGAESATAPAARPEQAIAALLDAWHEAAARADEDAYLGAFAPDAVFLGTDATERWTLDEFSAYVHEYFVVQGRGWTYAPRDRHVALHADGRLAWFDELLDSEGYGELRGTGVVRLADEGWRLVHYNMTFTIPNEAAKDVVAVVRRVEDE